MPTITDEKNVYSTLYTKIDFSTEREMQKKETIPAQEGKRVKLEKLSMLFQVAASGVEGTSIITTEVDGKEKQLATFTTKNTKYEEQIKTVDFVAGVGKPVVIRWYLKSSSSVNRSRIKLLAYTFDYVDPEPGPELEPELPVEPETPAEPVGDAVYLMIPCASKSEAEEISEKIKEQAEDIEIYVKLKR